MTGFSNFSTLSTENFSTTNIESTSSGEAIESQGMEIVKSTLYATCGVFGVVGNILTTIILTKIKAKETRVMDFYMINLAIADLGITFLLFLLMRQRHTHHLFECSPALFLIINCSSNTG